MASKEKTATIANGAPKAIAELEAAVAKARQALAATEAGRAELLVASEPTTDLALETKRAMDLQAKQTAFERVITAQRRELEAAQAALQAALVPMLEAELAAERARAQAALDAIGAKLWEIRALTDITVDVRDRTGALRQKLGDAGFGYYVDEVAKLYMLREKAGEALQEMGLATLGTGPNGMELMRAKTPAEKAEKAEKEAKRLAADEAKRRQRQEQERLAMYGPTSVPVRVSR